MSENTNKKIYVPGTSVKEFKFQDGGSVLRFSIKLDKFAPFVKENKNENGYINFNITQRQKPGEYGDTHSVSLDTWKPKENTGTKKAAVKSEKKTPVKAAAQEDSDFV